MVPEAACLVLGGSIRPSSCGGKFAQRLSSVELVLYGGIDPGNAHNVAQG